jgi:hypothetical protein
MTIIVPVLQGDAFDFNNEVKLRFNLTTTLNLTGYTGRFQVQDIVKDYADITSKSIVVKLSANETASLQIGDIPAALKIYDVNKRPKTIYSDIIFKVERQRVKNGR